jgi:hypothetical protein
MTQHNNDNEQLVLSVTTALTMYSLTANDNHEQSPARSFHICNAGDIRTVSVHDDAYELIANLSRTPLPIEVTAIGVHSSGWASPITTERPSEHPLRQRVQLVVVVARDFQVVSAARFDLTPDEIHLSHDGEGHLADGLVAAMALSMRLSHGTKP